MTPLSDDQISRYAVPAAHRLIDAVRTGDPDQVARILATLETDLDTDATTTARALAVVLAVVLAALHADTADAPACQCDPDIRCTECQGCECRAGTCSPSCTPATAWTPGFDTPTWTSTGTAPRPPRARLADHLDAIAEAFDAGLTVRQTAALVGVSASTAGRARQLLRTHPATAAPAAHHRKAG